MAARSFSFDLIEEQMLKGALQLVQRSLERKLSSGISDGVKAAYRVELEAVRKLLTKF